MEDEPQEPTILKAELENGMTIDIQTQCVSGEEDVAFTRYSFKEVTDKIEGLAEALVGTLKKVKPQSATIEFGLEIGAESGHLTALLVKGTAVANLKVTLQWVEPGIEVVS